MSRTARPDVDFGILLHVAFARFKNGLHAHLADEGFDDLGASFGFVFRGLEEAPLKLRELAERLDITPQGALKIVDDMVAKGYVTRLADPADRRATLLALAPRGEQALAAAKRFHRRFEAKLASRLGARRVADTRAVLSALVTADEPLIRTVRPF